MLAQAVNATREGTVASNDLIPAALSDITVNIPVNAFIPEEYIPGADERVLIYRKVASADMVDAVDALRDETRKAYGPMPEATENYFMRARIKACASQMKIDTITVISGKLTIYPIDRPTGDLRSALKRSKARYIPSRKKLQIPLKYFALPEDGSLLDAVFSLLEDLKRD
jgi:transcription-repair coupling factor (superfamily II helicase)